MAEGGTTSLMGPQPDKPAYLALFVGVRLVNWSCGSSLEATSSNRVKMEASDSEASRHYLAGSSQHAFADDAQAVRSKHPTHHRERKVRAEWRLALAP